MSFLPDGLSSLDGLTAGREIGSPFVPSGLSVANSKIDLNVLNAFWHHGAETKTECTDHATLS